MTDAAYLELLASYEAALDAAHRSMTIARALADGYRSGVFASFDRDAATLAELRRKCGSSKPCPGRTDGRSDNGLTSGAVDLKLARAAAQIRDLTASVSAWSGRGARD